MDQMPQLFVRHPEKAALLEQAYERHKLDSTTSFNQYYISRRIQWGREVSAKIRLYLDTNYWVALRDVDMGRSTNPLAQALYTRISTLVASGRVCCPITYHHYRELIRQSDLKTRMATAQVIDRFSCLAVLQPFPTILAFELDSAVAMVMQNSPVVVPPHLRVWTRPGSILGELTPKSVELPAEFMLVTQKAMDDLTWSLSLTQFLDSFTSDPPSTESEEQSLINTINSGKVANQIASSKFEDYFKAEVLGRFSLLDSDLARSIAVVESQNDIKDLYHISNPDKSRRVLAELIRLTIGRKMDTTLCFIVVQSLIHAAIRHDPSRRFKPGDLADFGHAAAALPYFNYFFTEASLGHRVTTSPTDLAAIYGTRVARKMEEALELISGIP